MHYSDFLLKADIDLSASGDTTVISATTGRRIAIDGMYFVAGSAVNVQLKDTSTNYGGLLRLGANQSIAIENTFENNEGVITTSIGGSFVMNLSGAVNVGGFIRYRLID